MGAVEQRERMSSCVGMEDGFHWVELRSVELQYVESAVFSYGQCIMLCNGLQADAHISGAIPRNVLKF